MKIPSFLLRLKVSLYIYNLLRIAIVSRGALVGKASRIHYAKRFEPLFRSDFFVSQPRLCETKLLLFHYKIEVDV